MTLHPQPRGGGCEEWTNSHYRAALRGHGQRETLSGQQEASQLFFPLVNYRETNSPRMSPRSGFASYAAFPCLATPTSCPKPGNGRSIWWLSRDSEPPFFCLIPRRSSVLPLSFLPPLWLFNHSSPSIAGFLLFQPLGRRVCVEQGNRDGTVEERTGVTD